jgi:hypothetical protein
MGCEFTMPQETPESELRAALTSFETSVTTPIVSGELDTWLETVMKSWTKTSAHIQHQTQHAHPRQYEEISKADPALLPRVEQLRAEDQAIEADRETLNKTLSRIGQRASKLEPDEAKAQPQIERVTEEAVALVARVRKQEVAVETWFGEAFNRERGGGD